MAYPAHAVKREKAPVVPAHTAGAIACVLAQSCPINTYHMTMDELKALQRLLAAFSSEYVGIDTPWTLSDILEMLVRELRTDE